MDSRSLLVMLCLLMTSSCQPWGMPDRRQPPPVVSFFKQLEKLHSSTTNRASQEPGPEAEDRPSRLEQQEGSRNQLNLFESFVPAHRVPRHLLVSPPMRGCHLGTCQTHNLANLLYRYGSNNQKDESYKNNKGTTDPMGYGRRKRRAVVHGVSTPT